MINRARQAGARSSREIASFLNDFGVKSPRGGSISHRRRSSLSRKNGGLKFALHFMDDYLKSVEAPCVVCRRNKEPQKKNIKTGQNDRTG